MKNGLNIFCNNTIKNFLFSLLSDYELTFMKLDQIKNGYKSNINTIRQLRDEKNNILDSSRLIKNILPGLVHSFNIKKNYILIKYFDFKNLKYSFLETKKLLIAISFPQLIDLLFISPGIKPNHKIIKLAKINNINIVGDIDIFWQKEEKRIFLKSVWK